MFSDTMFSKDDFTGIKKRQQLLDIAEKKGIKLKKELRNLRYEEELLLLQAELVNLQQWVAKKKMRVAIVFEGRDAAGKGGAIKRFVEHLNPVHASCCTSKTYGSRKRAMVFQKVHQRPSKSWRDCFFRPKLVQSSSGGACDGILQQKPIRSLHGSGA